MLSNKDTLSNGLIVYSPYIECSGALFERSKEQEKRHREKLKNLDLAIKRLEKMIGIKKPSP